MRKRKLTKQIGAMLPEETYENLIQITDEIELSVSEFIRRIIEENINQWKKEGNKNE